MQLEFLKARSWYALFILSRLAAKKLCTPSNKLQFPMKIILVSHLQFIDLLHNNIYYYYYYYYYTLGVNNI